MTAVKILVGELSHEGKIKKAQMEDTRRRAPPEVKKTNELKN